MKYYDEIIEEFEALLDEYHKNKVMYGKEIQASTILRELEPDTYEKELQNYIDDTYFRTNYKGETYYDARL